ncbi:MAG TPA: SRPBCC family protein [Ktedonobacteraceae bacterium]
MRGRGSILIERTAEAIFPCVANVAFLQQWVAPFRVDKYDIPPESHYREVHHTVRYPELRQVSQGAWGVGTTFKQSNESRSHPSEATIEITAYEPPTTFAFQVTMEMGLSQIKWVFEHASGGGTRATLIWKYKLQYWWFKLVGLIVWLVMRNKLPGSPQYMQRLKSYLEDQC